MTNLVQPFKSDQKLVVERRKADGSLDLKGEQPPSWTIQGVSFDNVYRKLFWADPQNDDKSGSWANLKAWLDQKGWTLRAKTW